MNQQMHRCAHWCIRAFAVVALLSFATWAFHLACQLPQASSPTTRTVTSQSAAATTSSSVARSSEADIEAEGIHPPKIVASPTPLAAGENLQDHIHDYFKPFDPAGLVAHFDTCTATDARLPEDFSLSCVGEYKQVNAYLKTLGLPPLGVVPKARISFTYSVVRNDVVDDIEECSDTIDRRYRNTGDVMIVLEEPCDAFNAPYPAQWDPQRSSRSSVQIIDRAHGIINASGSEQFPTFKVEGFQSREAIEAFMHYYGIEFEPLPPVVS